MTSILIVEDDASQRFTLSSLINKRFGYDVYEAEDGADALKQLKTIAVDVVIMDVHMPKKDGIETLRELAELYPNLPVIMLTGSSDLHHAVEAMKMGAIDFLTKPPEPERLSVSIFHALKMRSMSKELDRFKRKESGDVHFSDMIGHDGGLRSLVKLAGKGAASDIPILIAGETGVGKEVLARAIHGESARCGDPFIAINCAAIPEQLVESTLFGHEKGSFTGAIAKSLGKFREAEGGTIFLDEVGELPADAQAKLLRVLQQKEVEPVGAGQTTPVNVRIISATNRDLQTEVNEGRFREDLFFRLNVLPLTLPPLRQRKQDVPELIAHFMEQFVAHHNMPLKEISTQATAMLSAQEWRGNVRELENTIHRMMVLSEGHVISLEDVQMILSASQANNISDKIATLSPTLDLIGTDGMLIPLKEIERAAILFAMHYHKDNVTQAAKSLGIAKPTFYRRLAQLKEDAE